jgi:hypothetical protein
MSAGLEVADVFRRHGAAYTQAHDGHLGRVERRVMSAIELCRTAALGGHTEQCEDCGLVRCAYNSLYGDFSVKLSMPLPTSSCFKHPTAASPQAGADRPRRVRRRRPVERLRPCENDPRGARHWAQSIAPRPCIRLDPRWTRTMKQSFASAAKLRGGGPILPTASKPWSCSGHRHLGSSSTACRESAARRRDYVLPHLDDQTVLRPPAATRRRPGFRRS